MFIHEMFQQKPCVFSVEVFPPKKAGAAEETLYPVLRELCTLGPDYISVTYGAGGGTAGQSTAKIASYIKNGLHVEALAHLTCVNSTRVQVEETLTRLREDNVENVLALRGDINLICRAGWISCMRATLQKPLRRPAASAWQVRAILRGTWKVRR